MHFYFSGSFGDRVIFRIIFAKIFIKPYSDVSSLVDANLFLADWKSTRNSEQFLISSKCCLQAVQVVRVRDVFKVAKPVFGVLDIEFAPIAFPTKGVISFGVKIVSFNNVRLI